jgi:hypothetical protein
MGINGQGHKFERKKWGEKGVAYKHQHPYN